MSAKSDFKEALRLIAKAKADLETKLDFSGLSNLTELPRGILNLSELTVLDLGGTKIRDISQIEGLKALTWLDLSETKVTDLYPLREMVELSWLKIISTHVTDLTPLVSLTALKRLELDGSSVLDLRPLRSLQKLTTGKGVSKSDPDYFGGLTFTDCAATRADPLIAQIGRIADPAERAKALFAYLDSLPDEKPAVVSGPATNPPAPQIRRAVFLPAVNQITSAQLKDVLISSYPDLRLRTAHLLGLVQQEKAQFALLPIPNDPEQFDDHQAKGIFLETMSSGLLSLAEDLPEAPLPATKENAQQLKQRLKALAQTVDASIAYLDKHEGAYGGLWKIGLVSSVAGLLALIPGVSFLPATIFPAAVFGVQTVKLTIARGKNQKD